MASTCSIEELDRIVERIFVSKRFRPPLLPIVAIRLAHLADDPNAGVELAEQAVTSDPHVAARVVAQANSAALRGRFEITTLRAAISRLGLVRVRDIAFHVVAASQVFRVPGYADRVEALLEAATFSATLAGAVAEAAKHPSSAASLCGLLHDMGEPTVLGVIADTCRARRIPLPSIEDVEPIVARWHTQFGALVCTEWKLPELVVDAVRHHHAPEQSSHPESLAAIMAVVDLLLAHVGVGKPWQAVSKADAPTLEAAGLPLERMGPLLRRAENDAAEHRSSAA